MSVGKSNIRKDAISKVLGTEKFVSDLRFPGLLYGKMVMSPVASADIVSLNTEKAKKYRGVATVLTYKDIPGKNIVPLVFQDMPFLAENKLKFHGQPFALIAAESKKSFDGAIKRIKLELKENTPILSIEDSLKKDSKRLYEDSNIFKSYNIIKGDADKVFANAKHIVKGKYVTPYQEHAYLETQGMLAVPEPDGSMTVYGSMQCPFYVRDAVAAILGIPLSMVKIIQASTGGGFGGKEDIPSLIAGYAALLALKTKRPVLLALSREDDFIFSSKRHPGLIEYESAFDDSGKILGVKVKYYMNAGAFATLSPIVLWRGTVHSIGPYQVENINVETYAVATNMVPCGAYRGFGTPQILFAHEAQMDDIAEKLGKDRVEIRKLNLIKENTKTATGHLLTESVGAEATLEQALEKSDYYNKLEEFKSFNLKSKELKKGIGISTVFYGVGLGAGGKHLARSGAFVQLNLDGSLELAVGLTEMGQGLKTVISQIACSELGISYDNIHVLDIDTSRVPDSGPTVASRGSFMAGNAVLAGCRELKKRMLPIIKKHFGEDIDMDMLEWKDDNVYLLQNRNKSIPIRDLAIICINQEHISLSTVGWYSAPHTSFAYENGQGDAYFTYTYATNISEITVNIKTGELIMDRITASHEVGKAINPQQVEGQIQGGSLQGAGYAVMEEIKHNPQGKMITDNLSTYIIPTIQDTPVIDPGISEKPYSLGPYGAKGFGELPLMGIAPSIASALRNATGIKFSELPLTPERIMKKINRENI